MTNSIISAGLAGLHAGFASTAKHAEKVASPASSVDSENLVRGLTGLKTDELQIKASTAVIKTGQEIEDSVLDILA